MTSRKGSSMKTDQEIMLEEALKVAKDFGADEYINNDKGKTLEEAMENALDPMWIAVKRGYWHVCIGYKKWGKEK